MSPTFKLGIATCVIAASTTYMAYLGTKTSWKYYLTVDECLDHSDSCKDQRMRVSGRVTVHSLDIAAGRQQATFELTGTHGRLPVVCLGPLPDNLTEDMDVMVEGRLDDHGTLQGDKLLTRCASKYSSDANRTMTTNQWPTASEETANKVARIPAESDVR